MTTAGVAPLRVGMQFVTPSDLSRADVPLWAVLLTPDEVAFTTYEALEPEAAGPDANWPMTLLYLPRSYRPPVEGAEDAVGGTESAGGQVVAGTGTPTQEGYQQMMRQKSMAAHPAGKARG